MNQLQTLSPDGKPPKSWIKDARSAQEIWMQMVRADAPRSFDRARIDAAYNNELPLSQAELNANGEGYRCNVSWGFAAMVLNTALSGFVDLINATEILFDCPTNYGPPSERAEWEQMIAEEVTDCIRSWRDFNLNYQALVTIFIKHGVSAALFNDEYDWRWMATGLSDLKVPERTKVGQDNVNIAAFLRFYSPTELFKFIEDEEFAGEMGYNVPAIRSAIMKSVQNGNTFIRFRSYDWEKLEVELRNNSYWFSHGSSSTQNIRVVHIFWQEFDGRVSYGMFCDDDSTNDWLYIRHNVFPNTTKAFVIFPFGVGTNDYLHGVRGQGYAVGPLHQALNRLYCQALELAAYGSAPILQPKDESAAADLQFAPRGPFSIITSGVEVIPSAIAPNLSNGILPIADRLTQMFRERTANANTQALLDSRTEKTATQIEAELSSIAKMSNSSVSQFYDPFETLFQTKVHRMKRRDYKESDPGGTYIMQLHKRLLQRGGNDLLEAFFELDTDRLKIRKAIGAGSEAARMLAKKGMMELLPYFDEYGQQNTVRALAAEFVGYRNVSDFIQRPDAEKRPPVEASIAELQNDALLSGQVATVRPNDNHLVHARIHAEALAPLVEQVSQALTVDPLSVAGLLQGLEALNAHLTEHVQRIAINPMGQKVTAPYKQLLQQADEVIHNGLLKVQKLQEQAAQQAAQQQEQFQPQLDPATIAKIEGDRAVNEAKIESIHAKTATDIEIKQQKAQQEQQSALQDMALNDAKTAQQLRDNAQKTNQQVRQQRRKATV